MEIFFTCKNINVLKQEKPEMEDFERKQTLVLMEKYCENEKSFLMDTLAFRHYRLRDTSIFRLVV